MAEQPQSHQSHQSQALGAGSEGCKALAALLSGIAQAAYHGNAALTAELLRGQLYPEAAPEEFAALRAKMGGLLQSIASADMDLNQLEAFLTAQTKKQGGITSDQAAVLAKFWKNHRVKIHESLVNQSRWDNVLKNMNWRVDLKSQSRHIDQINTPVAIVEMELGKNGQESEFLCLEFDEAKVSQMLKKLSEIEESMTALTQTT
ncbi:COMM domain-containing protein 1 [Anas acuta]|uniref:COMM domain-containing protein 1 n=2 Tax=Anas TaxID=8835 RepID=A0A493T6X7_ANAPP|nr:COMM domain-containing protein 1 isoform X1 [Anas platyrhynchos]|eukprot:XP_005019167.2 COMM domain-containing protein 1 isoform X3 [Anas platyrhynchos]